MSQMKIPKRISTALIHSLSAGVVPRIGLEYIAVGRKDEIESLLADLENVAEGGASFRLVVGRYGSGKSFLMQIIRNYAMERDFVVADTDLSPERRLVGAKGQGLSTYRDLITNMSTKTRPDGGALASILERWISGIQMQVVKDTGLRPNDNGFGEAVEVKILEVVNSIEGMVHGFDFANVVITYWNGYRQGDDAKKSAALRWLRGEFATKTEARTFMNVQMIIDDESWYDYIKLMASFVSHIGYKGLVIFIDEGVNLYKITNSVSRQSNYEKLLTMFNDTMQGKAQNLGIILGGTPQFVEDQRRGLYCYEALRTRFSESRFTKDGFRDLTGPIIRLQTLTHEEIFVLLNRLLEVHKNHYGYEPAISSNDIIEFMQAVAGRMGADELLTPREVVRDFISILNILHQNPDISFGHVLHGPDFQIKSADKDPDQIDESEFAEFTL
ncbi:biotin carboxylase [Thermanaerosceptrum fracticalcis]|uniref:Biotin carboxylase n=1 Tax=Thermanaerosceptrum fracticalcis TaxID=1712410 RepID=A0A7G6E074_THEFR|nr:ATP-binding protein [Thermanaerosceptrum fracticalcis]QNB45478.1 biotin carboxylase [Thermanaerosceptrum fracticalcis]